MPTTLDCLPSTSAPFRGITGRLTPSGIPCWHGQMPRPLCKQITIRMTVDDWDRWKTEAEAAGISLVGLFRLRMHGKDVVPAGSRAMRATKKAAA